MAIYVGNTQQSFGQSAYDLAVAGGYTGTESQFNALLVSLGTLETRLQTYVEEHAVTQVEVNSSQPTNSDVVV